MEGIFISLYYAGMQQARVLYMEAFSGKIMDLL